MCIRDRVPIDVLRRHPEGFQVVGLSARGADPRALVRQALDTGAQTLALAGPAAVDGVRQAWAELGGGRREPELLAGPDAATQLAGAGADVVLNLSLIH